ncbi:MAG: NADH-quinone oxidoreductase subunit J [Betaproteobacteria bacterium]|nr:NADH-quinone oxidoreductase subunit J [Betaproteobacteria bacterium]
MNLDAFFFYPFAAILLFGALRVITARNPVHAALYLVLTFFSASAIWMLLRAEFLAIVLVVVYVGAVMVLFLFVVMMLDINVTRLREGFWQYLPLGLTVGVLMSIEMLMVVAHRYLGGARRLRELPAGYSNTKELGRVLYTDYAYAFEIAAVILLVAIIAAIALTLRRRKDSRYQDPAAQIAVKRADRVRLVSMPAEKD